MPGCKRLKGGVRTLGDDEGRRMVYGRVGGIDMEPLSAAQVAHFRRNGFFLTANPLSIETMGAINVAQRQIEPLWEKETFPRHFNRSACQFLMVGELLLREVERPELLAMARELLACQDIHVGACGLGDAAKIIAADGRAHHQVHWHADGGPEVAQVALRTALDAHAGGNGPLRVLPGSQTRVREEILEEFKQLELATGAHGEEPALYFARHPHEIEVHLDPRWTLVWNPSTWHATGEKVAPGPRRAMSWNYFPVGGRKRDSEAVKYVFDGVWQDWSPLRQRLWGLI